MVIVVVIIAIVVAVIVVVIIKVVVVVAIISVVAKAGIGIYICSRSSSVNSVCRSIISGISSSTTTG